jgi:WD40 repeat protein/serine/threonine protein kinase
MAHLDERDKNGRDHPEVPVVPDHDLLRCIGRGSYGEVWLARTSMGLYRAVKFVYRKSFDDARPFERELSGIRMFEPLSRSHDGFVDVLQVGINEAQGYFYYVMELGDDKSSGQVIEPENYSPKTLATEISQKRKLPVADCLQLGLALSQALSQLHRQGLVHRDIKPSNIIFVNGVPKLADIGLVTQANEARSYVGTEGFIPPEGPGAPQADVFSLGKVLYEASTGKDRHDFPELPTQWDKSPDFEAFQELNEVILQACRNEPSARYQSAWEMYCDLLVLADGKSVKRLNLLERRLSNTKRIARLSAPVLLALGLIFYVIYVSWKSAFETRQQQVGANIANGSTAVQARNLPEALSFYSEALQLDKGDPNREADNRMRFGSVRAQCPRITRMWFVPGMVKSVAFSPDNKRLVAVERLGQAHVFDVETGETASPGFGQQHYLWQGSFNPDGSVVVTASDDNTACLWKVADGSKLLCLQHPYIVITAGFSVDGTSLVTGCDDGNGRVWDTKTGQLLLTLAKHTNAVLFAAYSPDGHRIITTSRDGMVIIWDSRTGSPIGLPFFHPSWVYHAAFSPDGEKLVTSCFDRKARVWNLVTRQEILPNLEHDDGVRWAEFSPDGRWILTASMDPTVRLWDAATHHLARPNAILKHSDRALVATFSTDGHRIATGCADGSIRIWDLAVGAPDPLPETTSISEDRSRYYLLTDGKLRIYDVFSGQEISPVIQTGLPLTQISLSPDASLLTAFSRLEQGTNSFRYATQVWDTKSGKAAGSQFLLPPGFAPVLTGNSGGLLLATSNQLAQVWNPRAAKVLSGLDWAQGNFNAVNFSPSGEALAAWCDKMVRFWKTRTGDDLCPPIKYPFNVRHVEFSPDGSRVMVCGGDDSLEKCDAQIYLLPSGKPAGGPLAHRDGVISATFSPDGQRVVTAGEDFNAIVWEVATGRQLIPPLKHQNHVLKARFSSDGRWVLTASRDQTARIWSAETGQPLSVPLGHFVPLMDAFFALDKHAIITLDILGNSRLWRLPLDPEPLKKPAEFVRLLSGVLPPAPQGSVLPRTEYLRSYWRKLRSTYPAELTVSAKEVASWHLFNADESEDQKQWFAAAFHLRCLQEMRPGDASLTARLRHAQEMQTPRH